MSTVTMQRRRTRISSPINDDDSSSSLKNHDSSTMLTSSSPVPALLEQRRLTRRTTKTASWESKKKAQQQELYSFLSGLIAGVSQAGLFNPYDRALYLSVKHKRRFIHWENFTSPYQGFMQSIVGRAFSGGLFFPLERFYKSLFVEQIRTQQFPSETSSSFNTNSDKALHNFLAGTAAGATNALLLNPLSAVKYKTWGRDANRGMMNEALGMYRKGGGLQPFFNGMLPTLCRDVIFGGCYTFLRMQFVQLSSSSSINDGRHDNIQQQQHNKLIANAGAAAIATIVSGPFNFARNVQYATRSRKERKSIFFILSKLFHNTMEKPTLLEQWTYVQHRLRIGWGTARVAVGVAFGHHVYDICMTTLHSS